MFTVMHLVKSKLEIKKSKFLTLGVLIHPTPSLQPRPVTSLSGLPVFISVRVCIVPSLSQKMLSVTQALKQPIKSKPSYFIIESLRN